MITIRPATIEDANDICRVHDEIFHAGKRAHPGDIELVRSRYFSPESILCSVAEDDNHGIVGFQSLKKALIDNPYGTPVGWGIIGTHISPKAARQGIGRRLFTSSHAAALSAGLEHIEAMIGSHNSEGLAYYESMGFRTYKVTADAIGKCFTLERSP